MSDDSSTSTTGTPNLDPTSGAPGTAPVDTGIDPTVEDTYWRHNYKNRPYTRADSSYDDFGPAYAYGVSSYAGNVGRSFDDIEPGLSLGWDKARGASRLTWHEARVATRDAWDRVSGSVEE